MKEEKIEQLKSKVIKEFRQRLVDLDDLGLRTTEHPSKGDIYLDGLEIESLIEDAIDEAYETGWKDLENQLPNGSIVM